MRHLLITLLCFMATLVMQAQRYLGGDISLLPTYEAAGTKYYNDKGREMPLMKLVKKQGGWNTMRVRLFVDPQYASSEHKSEGVLQDLDYVVKLGRKIKSEGFKLMLDLHYSDTWADPAKQFMPQRWLDTPVKVLPDSVYRYTADVLRAMEKAGAMPDFIQVGNEISYGMMWNAGKIDPCKDDNWDMFVSLLKSGVRACREVCPDAKIVIHTERAGEWAATKGFYERLTDRFNVDYDIIGLSYYPMWHDRLSVLGATLDSLAVLFPAKKVMIVETAFYYSHENDVWIKEADRHGELYPISPEGQAVFTRELVDELKRHSNVTGLLWWFPEENACGNNVINSWINRGLFDKRTGRVLPALKELSRFK